jgi:hypothetical protein
MYFFIYLLSFIAITSFVKDKTIARGGHGGHGGGHHGGRHHGGGGIEFRLDLAPRERYYYSEPYYYNRYVPLYCEVYNDKNAVVTEVQIGNNIISPVGDGTGYSFSLRPGYYTIRWRVKNDTLFGEKSRNYSRSITVSRNLQQINVRIEGTDISVNSVGY